MSSSDLTLFSCSVGGNLPGTAAAFKQLCKALTGKFGSIKYSTVYCTEPQDYIDQPEFMNWCFSAYTNLSAEKLWEELYFTEAKLGRTRQEIEKGPRIIDIDLLLFGDSLINTADLTVPHPRMKQRAFVLQPLIEIHPDICDPHSGTAFREYLLKLDEQGIYSLGFYPYNAKFNGSTRSRIDASFPTAGF
ncbi:2-amino-4-hydroxy-6-hydroxymethyldihydropteridine diphosphokinase [Spirochaeta dissipatitropha]